MADREDIAPVPALIAALRAGAWMCDLDPVSAPEVARLRSFADRLEAVSSEPGWVAVNTATGAVSKLTQVGLFRDDVFEGRYLAEQNDAALDAMPSGSPLWRIEEPTDG